MEIFPWAHDAVVRPGTIIYAHIEHVCYLGPVRTLMIMSVITDKSGRARSLPAKSRRAAGHGRMIQRARRAGGHMLYLCLHIARQVRSVHFVLYMLT